MVFFVFVVVSIAIVVFVIVSVVDYITAQTRWMKETKRRSPKSYLCQPVRITLPTCVRPGDILPHPDQP